MVGQAFILFTILFLRHVAWETFINAVFDPSNEAVGEQRYDYGSGSIYYGSGENPSYYVLHRGLAFDGIAS